MEGASDRPPPETAPKRLPTKMIALIVGIIIVVAGIGAAVLLTGGAKGLTVDVTSDKSSAVVNETITFNASATGGGTATNYSWNFGDGISADTTGSSITHAYQFPGSYLVVVSVKDDKGTTGVNWGSPLSISIQAPEAVNASNDSAPVANAGSNSDVIKSGETVTFNALASSAWSNETTPDGNVSNYSLTLDPKFVGNFTWDFGDASSLVAGNSTQAGNVTHKYTDNGKIYPANVEVKSIHNTIAKYYNTIVVLPTNYQVSSGYIKHPDTIVEEEPGQPQYLDPAVDYESSGIEIIQNVYETLVWYDGSSTTTLKPMIASEVPTLANGGISQDGLNYTFKIKTNVKFHDGTTVTLEDVRYSMERVLRINNPYGPAMLLKQVLVPNYLTWNPVGNLTDIQKAVTVDDANNSVTFHLTHKYSAFPYVMAFTGASVVEKALVEANGGIVDNSDGNSWLNTHDAGTGPYKLTAWVPNQYIQLDAFDQYWQGAPSIKHVFINDVNDIGTREMHLFSGDADTVYIDRQHMTDVQNKQGINVIKGKPTFVIDFIGMNANITHSTLDIGNIPSDFFSDIHVRRAFAAAFDYQSYIQTTWYGMAVQPNGPIPEGMSMYNASIPKYQYDPQTVVKEMQLANDTRPGHTGTYYDNGFTITLFYDTGNMQRETACEYLEKGLKQALGDKVTINIVGLDWGTTYMPAEFAGQLTCFMLGWAPDYPDPDDYVAPFLETGGTYPITIGLDNASLTENVSAAASELNETARYNLYSNISMDCYSNAYYAWTDQATQFHVERSWVHGWYWNPAWGSNGLYFYSMSKS